MSKQDFGIEVPKVKVLSTGQTVTEEEAKKISTRPQLVPYEYAGCEFVLIVDPRKVSSEKEDALNEIQFKLADLTEIDLSGLVVPADGNAEAVADEVTKKITGNLKFKEMASVMREMEVAQIEMLAPAVLGSNDPAEENAATVENLKRGGKLAKVQLDALNKWWNPTAAKPTEDEKKTEDQKSTN